MKQNIRILAAENITDIIPTVGELYNADIFTMPLNEQNPVRKISVICPDIVFINMFSPYFDAINVINAYSEIFNSCGPSFVVITSSVSDELRKELNNCNIYDTLEFPCNPAIINNIIHRICRKNNCCNSSDLHDGLAAIHKIHDTPEACALESKVESILHNLGFSDMLSGYAYLKRAIVMAVENEDAMYHITRYIYPTIASEYNTTPSSVERKIHGTICKVWESSNHSILENYFGNTVSLYRGRPANGEFIAAISDRIRLFSAEG